MAWRSFKTLLKENKEKLVEVLELKRYESFPLHESRLTSIGRFLIRSLMKAVTNEHLKIFTHLELKMDNIVVNDLGDIYLVRSKKGAHGKDNLNIDNRSLMYVIQEIFEGIEMPKDVGALCDLLGESSSDWKQKIIYDHPCMWVPYEVVSNVLVMKLQLRAGSKIRGDGSNVYKTTIEDVKDTDALNWEDCVSTVKRLKKQLDNYYKALEKKRNSESAIAAQVGDETSPSVAVSPKTPTQSPMGGRVATLPGIGLVGSSRGTAGSSGSQRRGTAGSSGSRRAVGSVSLLWFMASCYGHQTDVPLEKIEQDFFVLFPRYLSDLVKKTKKQQFIKDICERKFC